MAVDDDMLDFLTVSRQCPKRLARASRLKVQQPAQQIQISATIPPTTPLWIPLDQKEPEELKSGYCEVHSLRCPSAHLPHNRFNFSLVQGVVLAQKFGAAFRTTEMEGKHTDALWTRKGQTYRMSLKVIHERLWFYDRAQTVTVINTQPGEDKVWAWPEKPMFDYLMISGFNLHSGVDIAIIPEHVIRTKTKILADKVTYQFQRRDAVDYVVMETMELWKYWANHFLIQDGRDFWVRENERQEHMNTLWDTGINTFGRFLIDGGRAYAAQSIRPSK